MISVQPRAAAPREQGSCSSQRPSEVSFFAVLVLCPGRAVTNGGCMHPNYPLVLLEGVLCASDSLSIETL